MSEFILSLFSGGGGGGNIIGILRHVTEEFFSYTRQTLKY